MTPSYGELNPESRAAETQTGISSVYTDSTSSSSSAVGIVRRMNSGLYQGFLWSGVGVEGLAAGGSGKAERVVHVGVGGWEPAHLQPTEEIRARFKLREQEESDVMKGFAGFKKFVPPEGATCVLLILVVMVTTTGSSVLQQLQPIFFFLQ